MRYLVFCAICAAVSLMAVVACDSGSDGDGDGDVDGDVDGDADGDGDADEVTASAGYSTCVGRFPGTCSDHCCASSNDHNPIDPHPEVTCVVVPGSEAGVYRLSFSIFAPDGGTAIEGVEVEFSDSTTELTMATSCMSFSITEESVVHTTATCDNLSVRVDGGGGCEVRLHVDEAFSIFGEFLCREIEVPEGDASYLSTIYLSEMGVGDFQIDNCEFRL